MDGLEFLSHPSVRSLGLPVILMTAYATIPFAVRAMKLGAADILEKPFSGEELLAALNSSLGAREQPVRGSSSNSRGNGGAPRQFESARS